MKPESIVEKTLAQLLAEFRETSTSDSDKGSKFERLTKFYLIKDPIWSEQLSNVRLREEANIGPDVGIDLVADDIASGGKVAIQCKFYDERTYLDDLGTFYTSSGKDGYVKRIVITTSNQWTRNAEEALKNQQIPVQRILLHDMEQSLISWGAFDLTENYGSVPIAQKELRPHQIDALTAVMAGFKDANRGKMIMACGTGKTLISLRIAEEFFKKKKTPSTVLFLAPSISLLSQTIMEWGQNKKTPYMALAVCSDAKVGKKDDDDMQVTDLAIPASTDVEKLTAALANRGTKNMVIFSTYQSLEIISKAQKSKKNPLSEFDLVVCDEAHRTTGVTTAAKAAVEDFSHFVRIHDNSYVKASKRLYMTATPKIYKDVDNKVAESGGVIASMDDPEKFGEEFYRLGFGTAVERGLLSDYRVLILAVDEEYVARVDLERFRSEDSTINLDDASKLLGCWRGLSKIKTRGEDVDDMPMKRAVAFANTIDASQVLAKRLDIVGRTANRPAEGNKGLLLQTMHVDGRQNALVRRRSLEWLKADPGPQTARILTNARCLSEGIDVPALDAVIFTEARGSQVDIVQAVGRVMRKYEGKNSGYIILPVAITAGADIDSTLKGTKYKVIWDVLNALRAHDDRFDVTINQINLNQDRDSKIEVDVLTGSDNEDVSIAEQFEQGILVHLPSQIADGIYAKIVEKVGERDYWEKWAKDIAEIAKMQEIRISKLVNSSSGNAKIKFEAFLKGLRDSLNSSISRDEGIEMLAQHMITKPIFDSLFTDYKFADNNPVSMSMDGILKVLNEKLEPETKLEVFYDGVRKRVEGIDNNASRQKLITDLYGRFFKLAFPKMTEKLGIVYTPIEIVDFIIKSAEYALKSSFSSSITNKDVHVLDPFTGTGTFITRLLQSGIISKTDLLRKYNKEIHANEIVLLAYYIGAINIESTFAELNDNNYLPFDGMVLADTFQMFEKDDELDLEIFVANNKRSEIQKSKDITVIIGNPPYSAGQSSANDNNQNMKYPTLDSLIAKTYGATTSSNNKSKLYDSYIRAIRWASDRIKKDGVICYVTNNGFIDSNMAEGLRKSLYNEFSDIYIYNLRGNSRTVGELAKNEGGNVFDIRVGVAIICLVKKANSTKNNLYYFEMPNALNKKDKLNTLVSHESIANVPWTIVSPNKHGDWNSKRTESYTSFVSLGSKEKHERESTYIFNSYGRGVGTSRDAWLYNFSNEKINKNAQNLIRVFNSELARWKKSGYKSDPKDFATRDKTLMSWSTSLYNSMRRKVELVFSAESSRVAFYRPFVRQFLYFDDVLNNEHGRQDTFFPNPDLKNFGFYISGLGSVKEFSSLIIDKTPDVNFWGSEGGQFFPRFTYNISSKNPDLFTQETVENFQPIDNVSSSAVTTFSEQLGFKVTKDQIFYYTYAILNCPEYRNMFVTDLKKMMPRIPISSNFELFADLGKSLSDLHLKFDEIEEYPLSEKWDGQKNYEIKKMTLKKSGEVNGTKSIIYNDNLTLIGIPDRAFEYTLGSKSAIDWLISRYQVKKDEDSGIVNNPNDWLDYCAEPDYIVKLLKRIVTLSLKSLEIREKMPPLNLN